MATLGERCVLNSRTYLAEQGTNSPNLLETLECFCRTLLFLSSKIASKC